MSEKVYSGEIQLTKYFRAYVKAENQEKAEEILQNICDENGGDPSDQPWENVDGVTEWEEIDCSCDVTGEAEAEELAS